MECGGKRSATPLWPVSQEGFEILTKLAIPRTGQSGVALSLATALQTGASHSTVLRQL